MKTHGETTMNRNRIARYFTHELAMSQGYVRTPGGFRHKSFVHRLQPGQGVVRSRERTSILNLANKQTVDVPAPQVPAQNLAGAGGGWVTWATWVNSTGARITSFVTSWVVPPAPATENNQLIYLFNGLEDSAGVTILQPVLQWGVSGAGGGPNWSAASWFVDSAGHAFCTPVTAMNPGDRLTGIMTLAVQGDGSLNYACKFSGLPDTALIAQGLTELVMASETLEVYGLQASTDYPNVASTAMTAIDLEVNSAAAVLNWTSETMANPNFGEHTVIVSNASPYGEVDLFY
jgi:hypothetical protein